MLPESSDVRYWSTPSGWIVIELVNVVPEPARAVAKSIPRPAVAASPESPPLSEIAEPATPEPLPLVDWIVKVETGAVLAPLKIKDLLLPPIDTPA